MRIRLALAPALAAPLLALGLTLALAAGGCVNRSIGPVFGRPTGTCAGACDHYLWCKAQYGDKIDERSRQTCELECPEVFSGAESLAAFESLSCDDTVAFVEGDSGRGPGTLLSDAPQSPQSTTRSTTRPGAQPDTTPDTKSNTEPAGAEPAGAEPAGAEPAGAEPRSSHAPGPEAP